MLKFLAALLIMLETTFYKIILVQLNKIIFWSVSS